MRFFLAFLFFLSYSSCLLFAQSPSIQLTTGALQLCQGASLTIYYTTTGTFDPTATFRLQIATEYGQSYKDISGSITTSPATTPIPDDLVVGQKYYLRLVSDKPTIQSNSLGPFRAMAVPTAKLLGSSADSSIISLGESVELKLSLTGGEPYSMSINDSLRFVQTLPASATNSLRVIPEKPTFYRLTRIQNGCGRGQVAGTVSVNVSSISFRITKFPGGRFCPGDTLYPTFDTNTPLPTNTQFSIDWVQSNGSLIASTIASIRKQSLVIPVPKSLPGLSTNGIDTPYTLIIRQSALNVRVTIPTVYRRPTPSLALTESSSISFGQSAKLLVKGANVGSGTSIVLQDSSLVNLAETVNQGIYQFGVQPLTTTEYTIKQTFSGTCDALAERSGKATVTVTPGMRIDSLFRTHVCAGDEIGLTYRVNFPFTGSVNDFIVDVGNALADGKLAVKNSFKVTRIEPGRLYFKVSDITPPAFYSIRVRRISDSLSSSIYQGIYVNTLPSVTLSSGAQQLERPQLYYMYAVYKGGTDGVDMKLSDGTQLAYTGGGWSNTYDNTYSILVPASADYVIQSVRNQCGTGQSTGIIRLTVIPPTAHTIQILTMGSRSELPTQALFCSGQQTTVQFAATGPRQTKVSYKVEIAELFGAWTGMYIGTGAVSPINITLPVTSGNFKLRIVASDGTISNEVGIQVDPTNIVGKLTLNYYGPINSSGSSIAIPTYPKSTIYLISSAYDALIRASSGPLNGKWISYSYTLGEPDYPTKPTTYSIQSISKACVTQIYSSMADVKLQPFVLQQNSIDQYICPGNKTMTIPYTLVGIVPPNTHFFVDVTDANGLTQTLVASGGSDYVQIPIDGLLPTKEYTLQLKALLPDQRIIWAQKGNNEFNNRLTMRQPFTISLSADQKQTVIDLKPNDFVTLYLNGNDTFDAVLSNGFYTSRTNASNWGVQPMRTTDYKIRSAWGDCGYSFPTTTVTVRVKPDLRTYAISSGNICQGQPLSISFQAIGDYEPGHQFGIFLQRTGENQWLQIAQTTDLDYVSNITIPNTIKSGTYRIKVESITPSAVQLSKEIGTISIQTKPALVLSGNTTIYSGDVVRFQASGAGGSYGSVLLYGGTYPILGQIRDDQLVFIPTVSGTYQLKELSNYCGAGTVTGSVTVNVLPSTNQTLRITSIPAVICAGQTTQVQFLSTGSFGPNNQFTVQLSDSTGTNFKPLSTTTTTSALTVVIPANLPSGKGYRLRLVSSEPAVEGASGLQVIQISAVVSGTLIGSNSVLKGDSSILTLTFSGIPAWRFTLQNERGSFSDVAAESPYKIHVRIDTTTTYKLVNVSTATCGTGQVYGEARIIVSPLTPTEPLFSTAVEVFPNPTTQTLTIKLDNIQNRPMSIFLKDPTGRLLYERHYSRTGTNFQESLSLNNLPTGIYLLELVSESNRMTSKILKY